MPAVTAEETLEEISGQFDSKSLNESFNEPIVVSEVE